MHDLGRTCCKHLSCRTDECLLARPVTTTGVSLKLDSMLAAVQVRCDSPFRRKECGNIGQVYCSMVKMHIAHLEYPPPAWHRLLSAPILGAS